MMKTLKKYWIPAPRATHATGMTSNVSGHSTGITNKTIGNVTGTTNNNALNNVIPGWQSQAPGSTVLATTLFCCIAFSPLTLPAMGADYRTYAHADWESIQNVSKRAVVQITAYMSKDRTFEPFKNERDDESGIGCGTGFFFADGGGEILTNYHVVQGAQKLEIMMPGQSKSERFEVTLVGCQPALDVALLKLTDESRKKFETFLDEVPGCAGEIQTVELGDSELLKPTSEVMALGYPLTAEIKRTIGRLNGISYQWKNNYMHYQVDAVLNPGNSGGPVFDSNGTVIGLVVAGRTEGQATNWIIPINYVKNLIEGMRAYGILTTNLGLHAQRVTSDLRAALNCDETGVRITHIRPGSAAAQAGLKAGDIIIKVGEHAVDDDGQIRTDWLDVKISFKELFNRLAIDESIDIEVMRNAEKQIYSLTISAKTNAAICKTYPPLEKIDYRAFGGLVIQPLKDNHFDLAISRGRNGNSITSPYLYALLQNDRIDHEKMLVISKVYRHSHADDQKVVRAGDIIYKVNGAIVRTLSDLDTVLQNNESDHLTLEMVDDGRIVTLHVPTIREREDDLIETHGYEKVLLS